MGRMSHRPADDGEPQTGTEVRDLLFTGVRDALEQCAVEADGLAERLTRSGKNDEAMVAVQLAAIIRTKKPA